MAGRLEGKVALITGGASGQGRMAAMMFAQEGARIALSDMQEEGGMQTQHMVTENGGEALFVAADVSSEASAKNMVEAALQRYGRLDILYNNAGIVGQGRDTDVANLEFDAWNQVIQVNLSGIFLALIMGSATLCFSRWTQRCGRQLHRVQYRGKHRAWLLSEKAFRCCRAVRPGHEKVVNRGEACPFARQIEASKLMVA